MNAIYRLYQLQSKDVINISDGRNVGRIADVEIDGITGGIIRMIISGKPRYFGLFGRGDDVCIPWQKIKLIGIDSILVDFPELRPAEERPVKSSFWNRIFD